MDKASQYANMTTSQLLREYRDMMDAYRTWVNKDIWLHEAEQEEVVELFTIRDGIHTLVQELHLQGVAIEEAEIRRIDTKWQKWILSHRDVSFDWPHNDPQRPKEHWWEWVDQLSSLTDKQRSTL